MTEDETTRLRKELEYLHELYARAAGFVARVENENAAKVSIIPRCLGCGAPQVREYLRLRFCATCSGDKPR